MKSCDRVFLSRVGENNYYKIAFVFDNKEYFPFELKQKISLSAHNFCSLYGKSPDDITTTQFSMITTKSKAKELLATCESDNYPDEVLDFMNIILN
ncbi:MAG: hypothetical protein U1C46_04680 [Bacteroidales bacterium]|nr:hypothetical protein [Bacteroidales bacterium]